MVREESIKESDIEKCNYISSGRMDMEIERIVLFICAIIRDRGYAADMPKRLV